MCDFYLLSSEIPGLFEPRACKVIRKLRARAYGKYILVSVNPDIPKEAYETDHDISQLVLMSRDIFTSLLKVMRKQCPVDVDIYTLQPDSIRDDVHLDIMKSMKSDRGFLFKTENDAWEMFRKDIAASERAQSILDALDYE